MESQRQGLSRVRLTTGADPGHWSRVITEWDLVPLRASQNDSHNRDPPTKNQMSARKSTLIVSSLFILKRGMRVPKKAGQVPQRLRPRQELNRSSFLFCLFDRPGNCHCLMSMHWEWLRDNFSLHGRGHVNCNYLIPHRKNFHSNWIVLTFKVQQEKYFWST